MTHRSRSTLSQRAADVLLSTSPRSNGSIAGVLRGGQSRAEAGNPHIRESSILNEWTRKLLRLHAHQSSAGPHTTHARAPDPCSRVADHSTPCRRSWTSRRRIDDRGTERGHLFNETTGAPSIPVPRTFSKIDFDSGDDPARTFDKISASSTSTEEEEEETTEEEEEKEQQQGAEASREEHSRRWGALTLRERDQLAPSRRRPTPVLCQCQPPYPNPNKLFQS